jgi:hypothetical protein
MILGMAGLLGWVIRFSMKVPLHRQFLQFYLGHLDRAKKSGTPLWRRRTALIIISAPAGSVFSIFTKEVGNA